MLKKRYDEIRQSLKAVTYTAKKLGEVGLPVYKLDYNEYVTDFDFRRIMPDEHEMLEYMVADCEGLETINDTMSIENLREYVDDLLDSGVDMIFCTTLNEDDINE